MVVHTSKLAKLGFITEEEKEALNEIYSHNPLMFDLAVKRCLKSPEDPTIRFPDHIFTRSLYGCEPRPDAVFICLSPGGTPSQNENGVFSLDNGAKGEQEEGQQNCSNSSGSGSGSGMTDSELKVILPHVSCCHLVMMCYSAYRVDPHFISQIIPY